MRRILKPRWRASSRPAPARPTSAASRPTWPGNARRWRVATRRRATACWATSTCCSPRSSATRCSLTCCASCWRAAPSSPRCTRARTTPVVPRASTVPSSRPRAQGRRDCTPQPHGRTPALHVLDAPGRRARRRRPGHRVVCADAPSLVRLIQRKARRRQADTVLHAAGVRRMPRQCPRAASAARLQQQPHTRMPGDAICTNTS